jgi:hypothetical protein
MHNIFSIYLQPFGYFGSGDISLQNTLTKTGLIGGLAIGLDATDAASYPGSGQRWLDISGNRSDFFLGSSSSVESRDPVFNGHAGNKSINEYWTLNGSQYFQVSNTIPSIVQSIHKNNADFTIIALLTPGTGISGSDEYAIASDISSSTTGYGFRYEFTSGGKQKFIVKNSGGGTVLSKTADNATANTGQWNFIALSLYEAGGANTSFFYLNGDYDTVNSNNKFDGTYSSPTSSDTTYKIRIGDSANPLGSSTNDPMPANTKITQFAIISPHLEKADLDTLFAQYYSIPFSIRSRVVIPAPLATYIRINFNATNWDSTLGGGPWSHAGAEEVILTKFLLYSTLDDSSLITSGMTPTARDYFLNNPSYGPANMIYGGSYSWESRVIENFGGYPVWCQIQLTAPTAIAKIKLSCDRGTYPGLPQGPADPASPKDFDVLLGSDGITWDQTFSFTGYDDAFWGPYSGAPLKEFILA